MFRCSVCSKNFVGMFPEKVFSTPCGHLFHSDCILLCLNKLPKCPFCRNKVEKHQLIKINFQIDLNWKALCAASKPKGDTSIVNLDETVNNSFPSFEESMSEIVETLPALKVQDYNIKTLITTSLTGTTVSQQIKDFLEYFKSFIPNSKVQNRLMCSTTHLVQTALGEGFDNILIINMHSDHPIGLTLMNLLQNSKIKISLKKLQFNVCKDVEDKYDIPKFTVDFVQPFIQPTEFQDRILHFFSTVIPKNSERH